MEPVNDPDDPENPVDLEKLRRMRLHLLETYRKAVQSAQNELDKGLRELDKWERELIDADGQIPVLVRTSVGAQRTVYHAVSGTCGRVVGDGRDPKRFREIPESKAKRDYWRLKRCTACNWRTAEEARRRQRP